jgi:hypothetical protein
MSEIKKTFLKRIFFIALGLSPILLLAHEKGLLRFIVAIGVIFSLWQCILLIYSSQLIVDNFFPPKISTEKEVKPFNKFIFLFSNYFFGASLIFMLFEIRNFENTILGTQLFWKSGLLGILLALLTTVIIKKTNPSVFHVSSRRFAVYSALFIGFFLFTASLGCFINHFFSDKSIVCKGYEIIRKSKGGKRNNESRLFLKIGNNSEERFAVTDRIYDLAHIGEEIQLCTKKGKLGYEFVMEFKTMNK